MEWIALLAFLLCLVYLPKFRKVMMWIGIVGGGLGGVGLGVWKIKDHYDQKRLAEAAHQQDEAELDHLRKKAARGEGLTLGELKRLGAVDVQPGTNELDRARAKAARGEPLTDLDKALLAGGEVIRSHGGRGLTDDEMNFVPDPVQPKPTIVPDRGSIRPPPASEQFDPDKYLREKPAQRKRQAKKSDWEVVPDQKAP